MIKNIKLQTKSETVVFHGEKASFELDEGWNVFHVMVYELRGSQEILIRKVDFKDLFSAMEFITNNI